MRFFKKLKKNPKALNLTIGDVFVKYGKETDGIFNGLTYSTLRGNLQEIWSCIPEKYQAQFLEPTFMKISSTRVPPHTDTKCITSLNFYLETSPCITTFYEFKTNVDIISHKVQNQTNGSIFDSECLIQADDFIAEPGDAYVLDVSEPHSVTSIGTDFSNRTAIVFQTNKFSFIEVCEMLEETGCL